VPESFTCPRCERTSYHPKDVEHGYCGACHAHTGADEVIVMYDVPVEVYVDKARGVVTRVVIADEATALRDTSMPVVDLDAVSIAENAPWPVWETGH
jgi:hypothetical protein